MENGRTGNVFYGWWIVIAAFLNLFFAVGIVYYGLPVFYRSLVQSLGFSRAELVQGFFHGFLFVGLPCGLLAGAVIDRIGARWVILTGAVFVGASLILMGRITKFWHYEALCISEVFGYVLAGPIANQVLIARWFDRRRGRAMGYAYFGLGLGAVTAPLLINHLVARYGWRSAIEILGVLILTVLVPVGIFVTRSEPAELGLLPDGARDFTAATASGTPSSRQRGVGSAVRSLNFWLMLLGSTLVIGAVGAVIQHFILFLKDLGFSDFAAARYATALAVASLAGRVLVGYAADRFNKAKTMSLFYFLIGAAVFLISVEHQPAPLWLIAALFGFAMGADYMLIPLVTAECFGTDSLGKILALIIAGYSLGQWGAPLLAGKIFDARHSYDLAWKLLAAAGVLGAAAIYAIRRRPAPPEPTSASAQK